RETSSSDTYTMSLHDALPISAEAVAWQVEGQYGVALLKGQLDGMAVDADMIVVTVDNDHGSLGLRRQPVMGCHAETAAVDATKADRKSTRLNSSHVKTSYAVF